MGLKLSEKQLEKQCMDLLNAEKWLVFQTHSRLAYLSAGTPGQPDLIATAGYGDFKRVLLLELKTLKGKRSTKQLAWAGRATRLGFGVHVIRSIEELKAIL